MSIKNKTKWSLLVSASVFLLGSCTKGFEEINDPKHKVKSSDLAVDNVNVSSFADQILTLAFPAQENKFQHLCDLVGAMAGRYMVHTKSGWNGKVLPNFNQPNSWNAEPFRQAAPAILSAFKDIERLAKESGNPSEDFYYNYALLLRSQAFLTYADLYGAAPLGLDADNPAAYNSQEQIYKQVIADLNAVIAYLMRNDFRTLKLTGDKIYQGNMTKWLRFANSLKLRIAVRIRFAEPALAKTLAEEAVQAGVIEANADNALMHDPKRGFYMTSVAWGDSRAAADIDAYLNGYSDPRAVKYFKAPVTAAVPARTVVGRLSGSNASDDVDRLGLSALLSDQNTPEPWLTAAEMWFCRAEGALAGWSGMGGSVEDLYRKAVQTSFEQWGAGNATTYLSSTGIPTGHSGQASPSTITPRWDNSATDEVKLERLITQKWIALFPLGLEAWSELRRTGYPRVFAPSGSTNGYNLSVPNRLLFNQDERVNNPAGYAQGVVALGGADRYDTKLWWQKK